MKRVLTLLGALVALIVVVAIAFVSLLDVNRYKGRIQTELSQQLNRGVELGPMDLKLFPPAFRAQHVVIKDDPQFTAAQPFAQVDELRVAARLLPLLHGDLEISSLEIEKPRIELLKN